jgi:hypothetical protein
MQQEVRPSTSEESKAMQEIMASSGIETIEDLIQDSNQAKIDEIKKDHKDGVGGIQFSKAEEAAAKFTYLLPVLKKALGSLSAKAAARVVYRLSEFPFGNSIKLEDMGFRSKAEKQLFHIVYELNDCKRIMMQHLQEQEKENNPDTLVGEGKENVTENKE